MINTVTLTRLQQEVLSAQSAYNTAMAIERDCESFALMAGNYLNEEDGERITDPSRADMMAEIVFINEYLPAVAAAFKSQYGITNNVDRVYSHSFRVKLREAENRLIDAVAVTLPADVQAAFPEMRRHWKHRPELVRLALKLKLAA
jgi:hypothetical protein